VFDEQQEDQRVQMNFQQGNTVTTASYGQTASASEERLLSVAQAAEAVGCSTDTIRRAYVSGQLAIVRIGSRIRVRRAEVMDWLRRGGKTR
jgi:excisionase family DNA binding protein